MSDIPRYRRTDPIRTGPSRYFSNLYRPYDSMSSGERTATSTPPETGPLGDFATGPRAPGVESAYRIFAEHMERRRQTASSFSRDRPAGAKYQRGMADSLQGLVDSYGEIAALLMEMLSRLTRGDGYGGDKRRDYENRPSSGPPTTYVCTTIPLVLNAARLCDVVVELYPFTDLEKLKPDDLVLVPEKPNYPTLKGVAKFIRSSPQAWHRRVPEQPQVEQRRRRWIKGQSCISTSPQQPPAAYIGPKSWTIVTNCAER